MAAWAMLLGMVTLINVTMVGAIMQLAGHIPDASLLAILSRYLKKRGEPREALLHHLEASARLQRLRRRSALLAASLAVVAVGLTVWALTAGWGTPGMGAVTFWILAANAAFLDVPLAALKRRSSRMRPEDAVAEATRAGSALSEETGREATRPEGAEAETVRPDVTQPEGAKVEATQPEDA